LFLYWNNVCFLLITKQIVNNFVNNFVNLCKNRG
jgi:hypothetical protein